MDSLTASAIERKPKNAHRRFGGDGPSVAQTSARRWVIRALVAALGLAWFGALAQASPIIRITNPQNGDTIDRDRYFWIFVTTATLDYVTVKTDNTSEGRATGYNYETLWSYSESPSVLPEGPHHVVATAYQLDGSSVSTSVDFVTQRPDGPDQSPTDEVMWPEAGTMVRDGDRSAIDDVVVWGDAEDDHRISRVSVVVDGIETAVSSDTRPVGTPRFQYGMIWHSVDVNDGPHWLQIRATDDSGRSFTGDPIWTAVNNHGPHAPPYIEFRDIGDGWFFSTPFILQAWIGTADGSPARSVVYILDDLDGMPIIPNNALQSPWYQFDGSNLSPGWHKFRARITDQWGQISAAKPIRIYWNPAPPNNPPTVRITAPEGHSTVAGQVTIRANASDVDGSVVGVRFLVAGSTLTASYAMGSWSATWDASNLAGPETIVAVATDNSGGTGTDSIDVNVNPLVVQITSPRDNAVVSGSVDFKGTASGRNFANYTLDYSPSGTSNWTIIRQSNSPVTDGTMGTLDTAPLAEGPYVVRLTANSSDSFTNSTTVLINVSHSGGNQPPVVDAGPDQRIDIAATANLDGTVTDDNLAAVHTTWSKKMGPGNVTFGDASAVDTTASFSQVGTYVLELNASDPPYSVSDYMTVTVEDGNTGGNLPPTVSAGPNQTLIWPTNDTDLAGTVSDDGKPVPPGVTTVQWFKISGPGIVTFDHPNSSATRVHLGGSGTFVLMLTASDGARTSSSLVTIDVKPEQPTDLGQLRFSKLMNVYDVFESTLDAVLAVSRVGGARGRISADYETVNGSAEAGEEYIYTTGRISFEDGDTTDKFIHVPLLIEKDPPPIEEDEDFRVILKNPSDPTILGVPNFADVKIHHNDQIGFTMPEFTAIEDAGSARISVSRKGGDRDRHQVVVRLRDLTATAGQDYVNSVSTLTFEDGDSTDKVATIQLLGDITMEGDEQVGLELYDLQDGSLLSTAVLKLLDNDEQVRVAQPYYYAREDAGFVDVGIVRDFGAVSMASVSWEAHWSDTGVSLATGTVVFQNGDSTDKKVRIPFTGDGVPNGDRQIWITITGVQSNANIQIKHHHFIAPYGPFVSAIAVIKDLQVKLQLEASDVEGHKYCRQNPDPPYHCDARTSVTWYVVDKIGSDLIPAAVSYQTADGSATAGRDYGSASGSFGWAKTDRGGRAFDTPIYYTEFSSMPVTRAFTANLQNPQVPPDVSLGNPARTNVTIPPFPNDGLPYPLSFFPHEYTVKDTDGHIDLQLARVWGPGAEAVTADVWTNDGTAVAGEDYTAIHTSQTFGQDDWGAQTITVNVMPDHKLELNADDSEDFYVGGGMYPYFAYASAHVRIVKTEQHIRPGKYNAYKVREDAGVLTVAVNRVGYIYEDASVQYRTQAGVATEGASCGTPGVDYIATSGTLSWVPGDAAEKFIQIPVCNDGVPESDEAFSLLLFGPTGGAKLEDKDGNVAGSLTLPMEITDATSVIRFSRNRFSTPETMVTEVVTAVRYGSYIDSATVTLATLDAAAKTAIDYTGGTKTLRFQDGERTAGIPLFVPIIDNATIDGDRDFLLQLSNVNGNAILGPNPTESIDIRDNETAFHVTVGPSQFYEFTGDVLVGVAREGGSLGTATVMNDTKDGIATHPEDYDQVTNGLMAWDKRWTDDRVLSVHVKTDPISKGLEVFYADLKNPVHSAGAAFLQSPQEEAFRIVNTGGFGSEVHFESPTYEFNEAVGVASVTVRRDGDLTGISTVQIKSISGTAVSPDDFSAVDATITFNAGESVHQSTFAIVDDTMTETDETFRFVLSNPSAGTTLVAPIESTVTIQDNDIAPIDYPPTVWIVYPGSADVLASSVFTTLARATDDHAVEHVDLSIDGGAAQRMTLQPPYYAFDVPGLGSGNHLLTVTAYDVPGSSASETIPITVRPFFGPNHPPTTNIRWPEAGDWIKGAVKILAEATDPDDGVANVNRVIDTVVGPVSADTQNLYRLPWDSASVPDGEHDVQSRAQDLSGQKATSLPAYVEVHNADRYPPSISFWAPSNGANVSGSVAVMAQVATWDGSPAAWAAFYIDNETAGRPPVVDSLQAGWPWFELDSTTLSDGVHWLRGKVHDAQGRVSSARPIKINVNNSNFNQPSVRFVQPGNNDTVSGLVTLAAKATEQYGSIASLTFQVNGGTPIPATLNNGLWTAPWTTAGLSGLKSLVALATDNNGAQASDAIQVTVSSGSDLQPNTKLIYPEDGQTIVGNITGLAEAADDGTVTAVKLVVEGQERSTSADTAAPYRLSWDVTSDLNGTKLLQSRAIDNAGQQTTSKAVSVTLAKGSGNALPVIVISSPSNDASLTNLFTITARATDAEGFGKVEMFVDDSTSAFFTRNFAPAVTVADVTANVPSQSLGRHRLRARVTDSAFQVSVATPIYVNVLASGNQPPTVAMVTPLNNDIVSGVVTLRAQASDSDGTVASAVFQINNGTPIPATLQGGYWTASWDTTGLSGTKTILVTATDNGGATGTNTITVSVSNPGDNPPLTELIYPEDGTSVDSDVTALAMATDDGTITAVKLLIDGQLRATSGSSSNPYSLLWVVSTDSNGVKRLQSRATDNAAQNGSSDPIFVTLAKNPSDHLPQISITSPAANATVSNPFSMSAHATDVEGLVKVDFFVDNMATPFFTRTFSPAVTSADVTATVPALAVGVHRVRARGTDAGNNVVAAVPVEITVQSNVGNNPPTVSIVNPRNNDTVSGVVTLNAQAADPDGTVASVSFQIDGGAPINGTLVNGYWTATWDASGLSGTHTILGTATDNGNAQSTDSIRVHVTSGGDAPPTTKIIYPEAGTSVSSNITVLAQATDDGTVISVKLLIDGTERATSPDSSNPYGLLWDVTTDADGNKVLQSRATDNASQQTTSDPVPVVLIKNPSDHLPSISITAPTNNSAVSNPVTMFAHATDDEGFTKVEFYVDDSATPFFTKTYSPAVTTADVVGSIPTMSTGAHRLRARVTDFAHVVAAIPVIVNVQPGGNQLPTVTITTPHDGDTVTGVVSLKAFARDPDGTVVAVQFQVAGGTPIPATLQNGFWVATLDATGQSGAKTIVATAIDNGGAVGSNSISVTVANGSDLPPFTKLIYPEDGTTIVGNVTALAEATDDHSIIAVQLLVNGANRGTSPSSSNPYSVAWDVTSDADGQKVLQSRATDSASQSTTSDPITVTLSKGGGNQPPAIAITAPTNNATVSNPFDMTAHATDAVGFTKVEFFVDDSTTAFFTRTFSPAVTAADMTATVPAQALGAHRLRARATNVFNLVTAAVPVEITVQASGGNNPPTVAMVNPKNNDTVSGVVTLKAQAADSDGTVASVAFRIDGGTPISGVLQNGFWQASWNTTGLSGAHTILVTATDNGNAQGTDSIQVTVSNGSDHPPVTKLIFPEDGTTIVGNITALAEATDDHSIVAVSLFVDGAPRGTSGSTSSPYSLPWDVTSDANSEKILQSRATDNAAQTTTSDPITVTLSKGGGNQPPAIAITAPANNATVSNPFDMTAHATDAVGFTKVELFVDDSTTAFFTKTFSPAVTATDVTATVPPQTVGAHRLRARATNVFNLVAAAVPVEITVQASGGNNPPTVAMVNPKNNDTVSGVVTLKARAADSDGTVASVTFRIDGGSPISGTLQNGFWQASWNTTGLSGDHTILVTATDNGNAQGTDSIQVTIANGADLPPFTKLIYPENGTTIVGNITALAEATDDHSIVSVALLIDGAPRGNSGSTSSPYSLPWDVTPDANGQKVLQSRATDNASQATTSDPITVTLSKGGGNQPPAISITAPANNATVSNPFGMTAHATDAVGFTKVEFFVDDAATPFFTKMFSAAVTAADVTATVPAQALSAHRLRARATNVINLVAAAVPVEITVQAAGNQPPTISIVAPSNDDTVSGVVTLKASAADADGKVAGVTFQINGGGTIPATLRSGLWIATWNTASLSGNQTILATATDDANGQGTASIQVTVSNGSDHPPFTKLIYPENGTIIAGNITALAQATDDGTITAVKLAVDGQERVTSGSASSPYSLLWDVTSDADGQKVLQSRATDNASQTATSDPITVTLSRNPTDHLPQISITSPLDNANVTNPFSMSIHATDVEGIALIEMYLDDATVPYFSKSFAPGVTATDQTATVPAQSIGRHLLRARVKDTGGQNVAGVPISVVVQALGGNQPPTVTMVNPKTNDTVIGIVSLKARAADSDGTIASVGFQIDGGTSIMATLQNGIWLAAWDTTGLTGSHSILVTATDNSNAQATDSAQVQIGGAGNNPPAVKLIYPENGTTIAANITALAQATDDGAITAVKLLIDGAERTTSPSPANPYSLLWDVTPDANGSHALQARAVDNTSQQTTSDVITVFLQKNPGDQLPQIAITEPTANANVTNPFTMAAHATDAEGLMKLELFVDDAMTPFFTKTFSPPVLVADVSATLPALATGVHRLRAHTTDTNQQTSAAVPVQITVSGGGVNAAPTVNAGPDIYINAKDMAAMAGSATDDGLPNGNVTTLWSKVSGPGNLQPDDWTSPTTHIRFSAAGIYTVRLTADDGEKSAFDDVVIAVNLAPVVLLDSPPDAFVGTPVDIIGQVTDDGIHAPGATVTYRWTMKDGPGTVTFEAPTALKTSAIFSAAGTYTLVLTASDGLDSGTKTITITVRERAAGAAVINTKTYFDPSRDNGIDLPVNLDQAGAITARMYNELGQLIGEARGEGVPGMNYVHWDGRDIASQLIFVVISKPDGHTEHRKIAALHR